MFIVKKIRKFNSLYIIMFLDLNSLLLLLLLLINANITTTFRALRSQRQSHRPTLLISFWYLVEKR